MGRRPHRGRDCTPALCCMAFGLGVLLALSIAYLSNATYNPFLYFRF